jgi:hypothetical protein
VPRFPPNPDHARRLLVALGAPSRLIRHGELVEEAAEALCRGFSALQVPVDAAFVHLGAVLHDAGKIRHPSELTGPGSAHEAAGQRMLLEHGVDADLARTCVSHARWADLPVSLDELVVALADKLWKGVRVADLEERVIDAAAHALGKTRWDVFVGLDDLFERVAAGGGQRLERSAR